MKYISEIQNEKTFFVKHEKVCLETPNSPDGWSQSHRITVVLKRGKYSKIPHKIYLVIYITKISLHIYTPILNNCDSVTL